MTELHSNSPEQTEKLAEQIGAQLKGGEVIELIGDLGAGKTTFVRGLAKGVGSEDRVSSPTFTVSKVYQAKNLNLHHYDFYRLDDMEIIKNELQETVLEPGNAVVLEWAEELEGVLGADHIKIKISVDGEETRKFSIDLPEKYQYIRIGS